MNCGACDGAGTVEAVPGFNYAAVNNGRAICPFCGGRGKAYEATAEDEDRLVGRYARTLPQEHYLKILKRVDYSKKPQEEQDRLVGALVRSESKVLKFQQILRSGPGLWRSNIPTIERKTEMKHGYSTRYDSAVTRLCLVRATDNVTVASVSKVLTAADKITLDSRGSTVRVQVNKVLAIVYSEPIEEEKPDEATDPLANQQLGQRFGPNK